MAGGLVEAFRYNNWANSVLLEACRVLSDEVLDVRPAFVSGSARELLVHIAGGQQTFVLRTKGRHHEGELTRQSPWPGFDELERVVAESSDQLLAIAETLDDDAEVDLPHLGQVYRFPVRFFLVHALEHGAEHRTEVKAALASLGIATPDLDGWAYAAAMGYGREDDELNRTAD